MPSQNLIVSRHDLVAGAARAPGGKLTHASAPVRRVASLCRR